ncbi:hypothetical protein BBP40_010922 [Aspergillus hancockii]|nr:hypothetical protein BBP40_010922 [Aspergillus hancockii]
MPSNKGAWTTAKLAKPLEVKPAPYPSPGENEVVVKNRAVAINPMDWLLQDMGNVAFSWLKYPFIFGAGLAGEVVEIGSAVIKFNPGDRVLGLAVGSDPDYSLATAASGLFQDEYLGLQLPSVPARPATGQTVLVWGGSTSVGSNAIQLVRAGVPEELRVHEEVGRPRKSSTTMGAASQRSWSKRWPVELLPSKGTKLIADISGPGVPAGGSSRGFGIIPLILNFLVWNISVWLKSKRTAVRFQFVWGSDLKKNNVATAIFGDFLPKALAAMEYFTAPEPQVIGNGLENI